MPFDIIHHWQQKPFKTIFGDILEPFWRVYHFENKTDTRNAFLLLFKKELKHYDVEFVSMTDGLSSPGWPESGLWEAAHLLHIDLSMID